eukprot:1862551-Pyramimonas_sp.AAC.1
MPLPMDGDLMAQVEWDARDILKYCRTAAKRKASPPWVVLVELTWMSLDPAVKLKDPERLSKKLEEQKIRSAELREDEGDLDKHRSLHKYR